MTITQTPLEKQIVDIALGHGMDERARPELMSNITTMENMVQDQTGAWVKRPGLATGPVEDASGTGVAVVYPSKVLSMVNGWGCVGDYGRLHHMQTGRGTLRARQYHMDLSATHAAFIGSSGPASQDATVGVGIKSSASSSTHDAHVSKGVQRYKVLSSSYTTTDKLTVCERSSGVEYVYDLAAITPPAANYYPGREAFLTFVGDRFLHLYVSGIFSNDYFVTLYIIDTLGPMPANEAAITVSHAVATQVAGALTLMDVVGGVYNSWVLVKNSVSGECTVYEYSNDGSVTDSAALGLNDFYDTMCLDEANHNLWFMIGGATITLMALSTALLATTRVAKFTSTDPGTYISANSADASLCIVYQTTKTFGGTTIDTVQVNNMVAGSGVTTVVGLAMGWTVRSKPFYMAQSNRHYIQLSKYDTINTISAHVIADISTFTQYATNTSGLQLPYGSFRVACNLEPYSAIQNSSGTRYYPQHYQSQTGYEASAVIQYQAAQRVAGVAFVRLRLQDPSAYGTANFSGSTYFAHGGLNSYDGRNLIDQGFSDMPVLNKASSAVVGNLDGSYRYVAVFRHVDANGVSSYSRTFGPVAAVNVAGSTGKNTITLQAHSLTNKDDAIGDSVPFVELYRTKNGGTVFYLCATSQTDISSSATSSVQQLAANTTTGLLTVLDNLSDTTLASQAVMFRQPGTTNAPADRYPSPACKIVTQHKDRLFCVDPYGQRVYYSSFFVDGEAAWFNPAFNFYVHAGTGPITALASMDGRLFVFKRDAVFVVDGDGPGEAGPTGNEFSPPQSLASRYGCIDHRSVVATPSGIVYRSTRGIEMIDRSLKVTWIGERVQNTCDAYPYTHGACLGPDARVHIIVAAADVTTPAPSVLGVEMMYDISADSWSVNKFTGTNSLYGAHKQSVAVVNANGTEEVVYANGYVGLAIQDDSTCLDAGQFYTPMKIETGWIKQGPQARQRVTDLLLLAKKRSGSNHALKLSIAYNYSDSYTQTHTFEPGVINALSMEELNIQPSTQQVLAIRLKLEDLAPASINIVSSTDTTPIVLTFALGHGFVAGDTVTVADHTVNTGANGTFVLGTVTATTAILLASVGTGDGDGGADGTVTYPVGLGAGCDVIGIAAEVAPKVGAPKLASGQKS